MTYPTAFPVGVHQELSASLLSEASLEVPRMEEITKAEAEKMIFMFMGREVQISFLHRYRWSYLQ